MRVGIHDPCFHGGLATWGVVEGGPPFRDSIAEGETCGFENVVESFSLLTYFTEEKPGGFGARSTEVLTSQIWHESPVCCTRVSTQKLQAEFFKRKKKRRRKHRFVFRCIGKQAPTHINFSLSNVQY